jgi:hypothetical protein
MATPQTVTPKKGPRVVISVYADPETGEIYVDREPFYVHIKKQEEVQWICMQNHGTHGRGCFKVEFEESPFPNKEFHHGEDSDLPIVPPSPTKLYKYTITVPDVGTLDPKGGVKG